MFPEKQPNDVLTLLTVKGGQRPEIKVHSTVGRNCFENQDDDDGARPRQGEIQRPAALICEYVLSYLKNKKK